MEKNSAKKESLDAKDFQNCLDVLGKLIENPAYLAHVKQEDRITLQQRAGRLAHPNFKDRRTIARQARKLRKQKRREQDKALRNEAGIREVRKEAVFKAPKRIAIETHHDEKPELNRPRNCYVCKVEYKTVHFFYDSMCKACGDLNYEKRFQSASLEGKTALVTGGRVKIGYQTALKCLRAGARTIVTTRFPKDAAIRFSSEEDFSEFKGRLQIFGLDLRHSPSVEMFAQFLCQSEERLDVLVNNAAQTVRKPPGFYAHLMDLELTPVETLPKGVQAVLADYERCKATVEHALLPEEAGSESVEALLRVPGRPGTLSNASLAWPGKAPGIGIRASAQLSMIPYDFSEADQSSLEIFPKDKLDADLQQVDLRKINSWRLELADVSTAEMLEVHLINAVAPFILAGKLKPLMLRVKTGESHVVNASAMEGKFTRYTKTDKHPHTNMAKAALNMLTVTSSRDYIKDGIHMNAVDTGWITDEDPHHLGSAKKEMHDFEPPLDIVDGAARLMDPVFSGLMSGEHVWGKFLKDYAPTEW